MRSNELRIGNIIGDTLLNTVVVTIDVLKTIDDHTSPIGEDGVYKPMPLTEEWLLKFGFKKRRELSPLKTPIYYISDIDIDYCFYYADFRDDYGFYVVFTDSPDPKDQNTMYPVSFGLKYIHQLQNIYFALTEEELKIK